MLSFAACGGGGSKGGGGGGGNTAPTANAGADQTVDELTNVSLNGSGSDANGDTLTYAWAQTGGTIVTLNNSSMAQANFDAPDVASGASETLTFQLTVSDGTANGVDSVDVLVREPPVVVTVSGIIRYEYVPANLNCNGLNFGGTIPRPIRGATVQLLDGSGAEIASVTSSDSGSYSFGSVAANTTVQIRVRAELKQPGSPGWDVDVRDNFIAGGSDNGIFPPVGLATRALYTLEGTQFNTGSSDVMRDLTATTGWGGSSYTGTRAAAPFALLDVAYAGIQLVRSVDSTAVFPPLDMFWSVNNAFATGDIDLTAGQLPTSSYFFGIRSLFILGDATDDPDEFDDHIVAHEWGHYFEDVFSRSESFGGSHFLGESLVASLAFGEGWASAIGSMLLDDPIYCDARAPLQTTGSLYNVEGNSFGVKGWFNEVSVATLIYDLWDTANDGVDSGSIGFGPIYNVMTGPQFFTESITTLFSFASALRDSLNAPDAALLDALLIRENVVSGVALDIWGTNETNAADVPTSVPRNVEETVLPLYLDYTADSVLPLEVCVDNYLDGLDRDGNNIGEDRYLRITVPFDDQYDVDVVTTTATPVTADPDDRDQSDPDIYIIRGAGPEFVAFGATDTDGFEPTFRTPTLFAGETYVAIVEEWRFDDAEASTTYPSTICFDVSFTSTP